MSKIDPEAREPSIKRLTSFWLHRAAASCALSDEIAKELAEGWHSGARVQGREKHPLVHLAQTAWQATSISSNSPTCSDSAPWWRPRRIATARSASSIAPGGIAGRFKDYISTPKSNGYRSIHTTVIGPERQRVEVQIRTQEMHDVAERGVAAHWRYRENVDENDPRAVKAYEWLRDLVDLLERGESSEEFYEHSKLNLYQDQVFCFTPKGMLISLPRGATPIDFAYFVHTDVGNTAVGAKINGAHTPLHTPLKNGDQVEIIRSEEQTPSPMWERFVATGRARSEIRRYLRHAQHGQHVSLGQKILAKVFADQGHELTEKAVDGVLKKLRLAKAEDAYADVGRGALRADEVLEAVYPELKRNAKRKRKASTDGHPPWPVSISGLTEGIGYRLGACCHPIPGDRIIGLMVPGEGVVIHTVDCEVLDRHQDGMADWIDVRWKDRDTETQLSVARILARVKNTTGALAALASIISQNGANISNLKISSRNPLYFEMQIDVEVRDTPHLENLIRALKVDEAVEAVERVRGLDTDNRDGANGDARVYQ